MIFKIGFTIFKCVYFENFDHERKMVSDQTPIIGGTRGQAVRGEASSGTRGSGKNTTRFFKCVDFANGLKIGFFIL